VEEIIDSALDGTLREKESGKAEFAIRTAATVGLSAEIGADA
jgi:hypothetical protein